MPWPLSHDYNEAVQNPRTNFSDPELREGQPVLSPVGLPAPCSGNFADVYSLTCPQTQTRWAVKCFTRDVRGRGERYAEISRYLEQARRPYSVDFQYIEQGIRVGGGWYPILKMRWVEGLLLNEFVRGMLDRPKKLEALSQVWARMAKSLHKQGIAHGDLQHGNVILVAGRKDNSLTIKLIDYDGMFVPSLAGRPSGEVGHPNYQHPQRLKEGTYSPEVDRFPLLVVATALRALAVGGGELWERYDNGDNMLFREEDLRNPRESRLVWELARLDDPEVRRLADCLSRAANKPLDQTPLLGEIGTQGTSLPPLPEGPPDPPRRRPPATRRAVAPSGGDAVPGPFVGVPEELEVVTEKLEVVTEKLEVVADHPRWLDWWREKLPRRDVLVKAVAALLGILGLLFGLAAWATWPTGSKKELHSSQAQASSGTRGKTDSIGWPRHGEQANATAKKSEGKRRPIEEEDGPSAPRQDDKGRAKDDTGRMKKNEEERQAVARLEKLGARIVRNDKLPGKPVYLVLISRTHVTDATLKALAELNALQELYLLDSNLMDTDPRLLAALKGLRTLILHGSKVTDAGIRGLAALKGLKSLHLGGTNVTDAGMKGLAALASLQYLELAETQLTDVGLKELAGLNGLERLNLGGTKVTDMGLKELTALKGLRLLFLTKTQVTDAGVNELRKALPKCFISIGSNAATDNRRVSWKNTDLNYTQFRFVSGKDWVELHSQTGQVHKKWTEVGRASNYIELQENGQNYFARIHWNRIFWGGRTVDGKRRWETGPGGSWQR